MKNQQAAYPEVVERLTHVMEAMESNGRSTPGALRKNDTVVNFRNAKP